MKDNSKFWAVCILLLFGGIGYFSREPLKDVEKPSQDQYRSRMRENRLRGDVTQLKSEDLLPGTGKIAGVSDQVTVNYRGTLLDGSEFDASYGREPFKFQLGQGSVIKGWDEGVVGMKEGGKRKLTIPASLGYGEKGSGEKIPPGATLIFEVELIKVGE